MEELNAFKEVVEEQHFLHSIIEGLLSSVNKGIDEATLEARILPMLVSYTQSKAAEFTNLLHYTPDVPFIDLSAWDTPPEVKPPKMDAWAMGGLGFYECDAEHQELVLFESLESVSCMTTLKKAPLPPTKQVKHGVGRKDLVAQQHSKWIKDSSIPERVKVPLNPIVKQKKNVSNVSKIKSQ